MPTRVINGFNGITEPEVQTYIKSVEQADGQLIEFEVANAINDFVLGCKNDGIWDAIKACCILAGARTLTGALRPLKGPAPTNNNFVSPDYNRKTGLQGGSTKYLLSNRNSQSDPQNDKHIAAYINTASATVGGIIHGWGSQLYGNSNNSYPSINSNTKPALPKPITNTNVLYGGSRSGATTTSFRLNNTNYTNTASSSSQGSVNMEIFRKFVVANETYSGKILFYSLGTSIDLTKLDTRVTTLMNTFSSVIPS